jgi:hypothetical protein
MFLEFNETDTTLSSNLHIFVYLHSLFANNCILMSSIPIIQESSHSAQSYPMSASVNLKIVDDLITMRDKLIALERCVSSIETRLAECEDRCGILEDRSRALEEKIESVVDETNSQLKEISEHNYNLSLRVMSLEAEYVGGNDITPVAS